jgi:hypothetical protein
MAAGLMLIAIACYYSNGDLFAADNKAVCSHPCPPAAPPARAHIHTTQHNTRRHLRRPVILLHFVHKLTRCGWCVCVLYLCVWLLDCLLRCAWVRCGDAGVCVVWRVESRYAC